MVASSVAHQPRIANGALAAGAPSRRRRVTVVTTSPSDETPEVKAAAPDEDIPHDLIATVAHELWATHGGNDVLNWLEAERLLRRLFAARRNLLAQSPQAGPAQVDVEVDGPAIAHALAAQSERSLNGHVESQ